MSEREPIPITGEFLISTYKGQIGINISEGQVFLGAEILQKYSRNHQPIEPDLEKALATLREATEKAKKTNILLRTRGGLSEEEALKRMNRSIEKDLQKRSQGHGTYYDFANLLPDDIPILGEITATIYGIMRARRDPLSLAALGEDEIFMMREIGRKRLEIAKAIQTLAKLSFKQIIMDDIVAN